MLHLRALILAAAALTSSALAAIDGVGVFDSISLLQHRDNPKALVRSADRHSDGDRDDPPPNLPRCNDLVRHGLVWGVNATGFDVGDYTPGLKWIGCTGNGCDPYSFYCSIQDGVGMEFGTTDHRALRALLGDAYPDQTESACATTRHPAALSNAMDKVADVDAFCRQLGYSTGMLLESSVINACPEVHWDGEHWGSDFVTSAGSGKRFLCLDVSSTTSTSVTTSLTTGSTTTRTTKTRTRTSTTRTTTTTYSTLTRSTHTSTTDTFTTTTATNSTTSTTFTTVTNTSSTTTSTSTDTTTSLMVVKNCGALLSTENFWNVNDGKGLDFASHVPGPRGLRWIGCSGKGTNGCHANTFFCHDVANGIEFGTTDNSGALRALIAGQGYTVVGAECATPESPSGVSNAMDTAAGAQEICEQLGYDRGSLIESGIGNKCPKVEYNSTSQAWAQNYSGVDTYGKHFRCESSDVEYKPIHKRLRHRHNPLCASYEFDSAAEVAVFFTECQGTDNQEWYFSGQSLKTMHDARCLDVDLLTDLTYMEVCTTTRATQKWWFDGDVIRSMDYTMGTKCLEGEASGARLRMAPCDYTSHAQQWFFLDEVPAGYTYYAQTCVMGHNIRVYRHRTLAQCAAMCNEEPACVAFEYGMAYGGAFQQEGDCNLNNGVDSVDCANLDNNFDLYVLDSASTTATVYTGETTTSSATTTSALLRARALGKGRRDKKARPAKKQGKARRGKEPGGRPAKDASAGKSTHAAELVHDNHTNAPEVHGNHTNAPEVHGNHTNAPEVHDNHTNAPEVHDNHTNVSEAHGNHTAVGEGAAPEEHAKPQPLGGAKDDAWIRINLAPA